MTHRRESFSSRGSVQIVVVVILLAVVVAGAGIWYFVFRDTAPDRVNIKAATKSVEKPANDTPDEAVTGIEGTWTVDTSIGTFDADAEDYSSAWVGYRVQEELVGIGAKTAFGRTPDVSGSLTIAGTTLSNVEVEADLTTLESDEDRRDGQLGHQGIETDLFPTATFTLTDPIDVGDVTEGQTISVDAAGSMTIHGVTRDVTIALEARLENDTIIVTGSLEIIFADYDIEKPVSGAVLSIEDRGVMELQLFFTKE